MDPFASVLDVKTPGELCYVPRKESDVLNPL
jgi:hypothetical protein